MKTVMRSLTLMVVLCFMSVAAFAGPYFAVEQNPLAPETYTKIGYDFTGPLGDSLLSITGDGYATIGNVLLYPWDIAGGFSIGLVLADELGADVFDAELAMGFDILPVADVDSLTITVSGYPGAHTRVYASIGLWPFEPLIGVECHW